MKVKCKIADYLIQGELNYIKNEFTLDYTLTSEHIFNEYTDYGRNITSIVFDTLEIIVDTEKKVFLYPNGFFPKNSWIEKDLPLIQKEHGIIYLIENINLIPGVSVQFFSAQMWKRFYDKYSGWIYYGPNNIEIGDKNIEFSKNSVISLADEKIVSLWLKPNIR